MVKTASLRKWGLLWEGVSPHLFWENGILLMFPTRRAARAYAQQHDGYIKYRPDLRQAPHVWRMPRPVKLVSVNWLM